MANIALQDGKVVLKDGKASCACCAHPCENYSNNGIIITKDDYNSWRKGGTIQVSGSIFDTSLNEQSQIDNGCPNGTCSWSYSNTITVPPNTCVFQFTDSGQSASCSSSYYGQNESPSISLYATAFKSIDESGEVYRANLGLGILCPHVLWFSGCNYDVCWSSASPGSGGGGGLGQMGFIPDWATAGEVSFLGLQFRYVSLLPGNEITPDRYANLTFTFTPNP